MISEANKQHQEEFSMILLSVAATLTLSPYFQLVSHQYTARHGLPEQPVTAVRVHEGKVYCLAGDIYVLDGEGWQKATEAPFTAEQMRPSPPPKLEYPKRLYPHQQIPNFDGVPQCADRDAAGHWWIGTSRELIITNLDDYLLPIKPEPGGLPYFNVTAVACDHQTGWVWVGFSEGAAVLQEGKWRYFWGRRWLPGNRVYAIALDGSGGAWFATDKGVARIEARKMRLIEKAAHYERINAARHNRYGFTADCELLDPEDPTKFRYNATDNDGLWTSITVAAQSFRYAVTKDPEARALARQSMRAMLELAYKTGSPGFVARAIAREDEKNVNLSDFSPERWKPSPEKGWLWKTDTSSDELDGHYFAWYVYHELVADEEERKEIAAVCRAVTDRILKDGLLYIRPDGKRTTWGVWAPEYLNDNPWWWQERALNAMEILSHLRVAYHICGDPRYKDKYEELIQKHHYLLNAAEGRVNHPPEAINHSDDELWFLAYYPIVMLEKEPSRRALIQLSIERSWRAIRPERSPLYNFIYGLATGKPCDVEEAVQTLQRWPWDLRGWEVRNSHRTDLVISSSRSRAGWLISTTPLPPDERQGLKWNANPYRMDWGGSGHYEEYGGAFLIAYWLGRYHKFIEE
jgi:hypothetical protein